MARLVTLDDISRRFRVSRRTISRYRREGMPGPVVPADRSCWPSLPALYSWEEVEDWAAANGHYDPLVGIGTPSRRGQYERKMKRHAIAV